ncbi:MAG TPA: hypothetical protein VIC52_02645 [Actinomycetota bacterium]|jgi:hypothetical protein
MRVEFYRPVPSPSDDRPDAEVPPPDLVGSASWIEGEPFVECDDEELRAALVRAYRKTPVVTDDASYRRLGTHGEVLIHPGDLEWFRASSFVRVPAETGLEVRLVPGTLEGGFDPAAGYRRFEETIERMYA